MLSTTQLLSQDSGSTSLTTSTVNTCNYCGRALCTDTDSE